MPSVDDLEKRLADLEAAFAKDVEDHQTEMTTLANHLDQAKRYAHSLQVVGKNTTFGHFARRAEWTITDFSKKTAEMKNGEALLSPKFSVAGMNDVQLEFFPKGREQTTFEGFCSIFLYCPGGTKLKYQLWVGSFLRGPNEDDYKGVKCGHGHSNFCPMEPQIDKEKDSLTVGVNILAIDSSWEAGNGLRFVSRSLESVATKEAEVYYNAEVSKVVWKIHNITKRIPQHPKGAPLYSPTFSVAGISEVLLEFYPNGGLNTKKAGNCAFYVRCPHGTTVRVTLIVGKVRKGPIKTTFEDKSVGATGKGLPDFCPFEKEIDKEGDFIEVAVEVHEHEAPKTIYIESEC